MMTIKQFIHSNPAKAMELFGKLLDTSDNALKTRERLLASSRVSWSSRRALKSSTCFRF